MSSENLYVVYWCDEQGYAGSLEFIEAESLEAAREESSYGSGGVAHQRLLFDGTFEEFRSYVEAEIDGRDPPEFTIDWE